MKVIYLWTRCKALIVFKEIPQNCKSMGNNHPHKSKGRIEDKSLINPMWSPLKLLKVNSQLKSTCQYAHILAGTSEPPQQEGPRSAHLISWAASALDRRGHTWWTRVWCCCTSRRQNRKNGAEQKMLWYKYTNDCVLEKVPPAPSSFMTVVLNTKPVCCYEKRSKVGRNSLEETILHPCVESSAHVRSPPRLSCSEENPVQAASNQPVPAYQWACSAQAPHSSQSQQLSAGELRRPRQASLQVCVSLSYAPIFWRRAAFCFCPLFTGRGHRYGPALGGSCYSDCSCFNDGAHVASPRSFGKHVSKEATR